MNGRTVSAWWLNALIITVTLLIWFSVIGTVATTTLLVYGLSNVSTESESDTWTDSGGFECESWATDGTGRCPENPEYVGE